MLRRSLLGAAAGVLAAPAVLRAQGREIVLGLSMVKTGALKSPGEATETAVDIAVAEINAAGGIAGKPMRLVKFDTGSDPRQAATAAPHAFRRRERGNLRAVEPDAPGGRPHRTGRRLQERGLPRPIRTEHRHHLAGADVERDAAHRLGTAVAHVEILDLKQHLPPRRRDRPRAPAGRRARLPSYLRRSGVRNSAPRRGRIPR